MARTWHKWATAAIVLGLLGLICSRSILFHHFEPQFLTTGPNGPETPESVGLAYERVKIPSLNRTLDAYLVQAPSACQPKLALLIFHGVMETISEWVKAQRFLYDHCVSSVVFDYSGHGDSSRPGTFKNLNQDAVAAYSWFASRFANDTRRCVLGHSMGNGPMLESLPSFHPMPACVVVANAFSSLRDLGVHRGTPRILTYMMPDVWNNVENISHDHAPLLLVGSDADSVNPIAMGQRIFEAAPEPKEIVVLHGFKHNALYQNPSEQWWTAVLQFLRGEKR
jgi:alpha-beta hydrolase superfamily lysophospholipase